MNNRVKTLLILVALATAAPAAVMLSRALLSEGGPAISGPSAEVTAPGELEAPPELFCRGREFFQVRNTSTVVADDCCTASIVGEVRNTCNQALVATISAALTSVRGRIVAVGDSELVVGPIGPGQSTFFRIPFSGETAWEAAQRRDVTRQINANVLR